jgi:hypothetical protein
MDKRRREKWLFLCNFVWKAGVTIKLLIFLDLLNNFKVKINRRVEFFTNHRKEKEIVMSRCSVS